MRILQAKDVVLRLGRAAAASRLVRRKRVRKNWLFLLLACLAGTVWGQAPAAPDPARGQLLYATHCISCHGAQLHWRDGRKATNWARLRQEVGRWQALSGLGWREEDVVDVTAYLNRLYYHFPLPEPARVSRQP